MEGHIKHLAFNSHKHHKSVHYFSCINMGAPRMPPSTNRTRSNNSASEDEGLSMKSHRSYGATENQTFGIECLGSLGMMVVAPLLNTIPVLRMFDGFGSIFPNCHWNVASVEGLEY